MVGTRAEPPCAVPLGVHRSFVRASDTGSGSHLCEGTAGPGCQCSRPAIGKGAPASPGHPCRQLQLPAWGPSPCPEPSPSPRSCSRRVSAQAASGHYRCQLPAGQGEAVAVSVGNFERFPDPVSHLYHAICLPPGTEPGVTVLELERRSNG